MLALPVRAVRVRFHEGRALADDSDDRRDAIGTYAEPLGDIVVAGGPITGSARAEGGGPAYKRTYEDGPLYAAVTGHASQACAPTQPKSVHQDLLNGTAPGRGR
ncbi:hypothetical protein AB0420_29545 [Streptomyces caelestis]|nr:hypothetical protein [Streptomyces sp. XY152]KOV20709.1 hypothetical protein ADK58_33595 [Streptomyces sp. XY152]